MSSILHHKIRTRIYQIEHHRPDRPVGPKHLDQLLAKLFLLIHLHHPSSASRAGQHLQHHIAANLLTPTAQPVFAVPGLPTQLTSSHLGSPPSPALSKLGYVPRPSLLRRNPRFSSAAVLCHCLRYHLSTAVRFTLSIALSTSSRHPESEEAACESRLGLSNANNIYITCSSSVFGFPLPSPMIAPNALPRQ